MTKLLLRTFTILLTVSLVACGGSDDEERTEGDERTFLRFFNAVSDVRSLDLTINAEPFFSNVGYLDGTGYFETETKDQEIRVTISGTFTTLFDRKTSLDDFTDQSLFVIGTGDTSRSLLLRDDNEAPGSDSSKIRIINASNAVRSADVYILGRGTSVGASVPTREGLGFGSVTDYLISESGNYDITVTERESKDPLGEVSRNLASDSVYTIVIGDAEAGASSVDIVLLRDR